MLEGELVDASAGATPYLKMFGQVLGGYYMGKAAILATKKLEETGDEYYNEKITLSKFYIEQLLPLASGYASSVTAGKDDFPNSLNNSLNLSELNNISLFNDKTLIMKFLLKN